METNIQLLSEWKSSTRKIFWSTILLFFAGIISTIYDYVSYAVTIFSMVSGMASSALGSLGGGSPINMTDLVAWGLSSKGLVIIGYILYIWGLTSFASIQRLEETSTQVRKIRTAGIILAIVVLIDMVFGVLGSIPVLGWFFRLFVFIMTLYCYYKMKNAAGKLMVAEDFNDRAKRGSRNLRFAAVCEIRLMWLPLWAAIFFIVLGLAPMMMASNPSVSGAMKLIGLYAIVTLIIFGVFYVCFMFCAFWWPIMGWYRVMTGGPADPDEHQQETQQEPIAEESVADEPISEPFQEPKAENTPEVEVPVVEQQQTANQAKDTIVKTADIAPVPKANSNSLKYIIGGVVCAAIIIVGGWLVYDKYYGSLLDKLELVTPIKFVESVSETALYAEPNVDADISCTVSQGYTLPVLGDCGEWYKVATPAATQEEYIKKSDCKDIVLSPSPDMNATYLTIDFPNYGSCYIVHRSDGKQLVLNHLIRPNGKEFIELGKYHEGVYVYTYFVEIENHYWTEYRKVISTDNGVVSLIDFNQIPEEHLTDPFEDVIKNNEKSISSLFCNALPVLGFRKLNISNISDFYKANHPYMDGNIAGKYDFVMFLDVFGDRVEGRYRVLQNQDGFVNLSGSITMGKVEVYEYNKDGSQTGYYFTGTLTDKGFSGKYLSTENKKLKMSFTSKVK